MNRKTNKDKRRKKRNIYDFEIEQDENISFIAGWLYFGRFSLWESSGRSG